MHALVQPADFLTASGILLSLQKSNQIETFLQETLEQEKISLQSVSLDPGLVKLGGQT